MGCDIHTRVEKINQQTGKYELIPGENPFSGRCYGTFAFLAGVRNHSAITPISNPRGFPDDASHESIGDHKEWIGDAHTESWLSVEELSSFDYSKKMEDRRYMRNNNGGSTCKS